MHPDPLRAIATANRSGKPIGIASWCTAHFETLHAIFRVHQGRDTPVLIEATCNQVNHHGGYTGLTPAAFRRVVETIALEEGVETNRIILGGDHLGPNPWKNRPASEAMADAKTMVRDYVEAGFTKIHLDASMACSDDKTLPDTNMAERAAELCAVAEAASGSSQLAYVIGTEVPVPGGETEQLDALSVTSPKAVRRTYELHREAFAKRGLSAAFSRVIGLVVQPGVDFGNAQVFHYQKERAADLIASMEAIPAMLFEAHSTDYQSEQELTDLVAGHFAILKVGPELTFAFREAVVAMAEIESRLRVAQSSNILRVISDVMDDDPKYWRGYISLGPDEATMKLFGLSDRVRYYWPSPKIAAAMERLKSNIDNHPVAPGLLSQFAGAIDGPDRFPLSTRIIQSKVGAVVARYCRACGQI